MTEWWWLNGGWWKIELLRANLFSAHGYTFSLACTVTNQLQQNFDHSNRPDADGLGGDSHSSWTSKSSDPVVHHFACIDALTDTLITLQIGVVVVVTQEISESRTVGHAWLWLHLLRTTLRSSLKHSPFSAWSGFDICGVAKRNSCVRWLVKIAMVQVVERVAVEANAHRRPALTGGNN